MSNFDITDTRIWPAQIVNGQECVLIPSEHVESLRAQLTETQRLLEEANGKNEMLLNRLRELGDSN